MEARITTVFSTIVLLGVVGYTTWTLVERLDVSPLPTAPASRFVSVQLGPPGPGLTLLRSATGFAPDDAIAAATAWSEGAAARQVTVQFVGPGGKVAYARTIELDPEWTETRVSYQGRRPLEPGQWALRLLTSEGVFRETDFSVR
ncbi:MAG: hypothetical protein ACI9WU_005446 [Myxococcota bacterium]